MNEVTDLTVEMSELRSSAIELFIKPLLTWFNTNSDLQTWLNAVTLHQHKQ